LRAATNSGSILAKEAVPNPPKHPFRNVAPGFAYSAAYFSSPSDLSLAKLLLANLHCPADDVRSVNHRVLILRLIYLPLLIVCSCASQKPPPSNTNTPPPGQLAPELIQARTMSFADRYVAAIADVYEQARSDSKTPDARIMAQQCKLATAIGALGNAVNPNPLTGLMDMAVMVRITRQISAQAWAADLWGHDDAAAITAALQLQENSVWSLVGEYLTPDESTQLRKLADQWVTHHPNQRFVVGARLSEIAAPQQSNDNNGNITQNVTQLASGVVSLVRIDPFKGLDPAVVQVEQARVLAERAFFYLQHMPLLLAWQTDLLYSQMLANPQTVQVLNATTTIANSTSRFTDATSRVSDATTRVAETVEKFREQLPQQQDQLMDQLNGLVASRSQSALQQAATRVSDITGTLVGQVNTRVSAQQDELRQNLQDVMNSSIDRIYWRLRSLVLILVGSIVGGVMVYKIIASLLFKPSTRR
jgi:hypothetical protein